MGTEKIQNIFEILNEKQIVKFLQVLNDAEKEYSEYQKKVNNFIVFFEKIEYQLDYDCENDKQNCDKLYIVSKILDKMKSLLNDQVSPIYIITEALKIDEDIVD